ncbi:MAG: DUF368 domain-containing protein [Bacilli bacterium]
MKNIKLLLKGALIGIANSIPGVSGGTIAVILGIYNELIDVLSLSIKSIKKNFKFIIFIGIGLIGGLFLFSKLLSEVLFDKYPIPLGFAFMGLIIGSIPFVYRQTKIKKISSKNILFILIGLLPMILMLIINPAPSIVEISLTPKLFIILFICAIIGSFAMIIPGISGSFVLLILGQYQTIINAVSDLNIPILIPAALGVIVGIVFGSRFIKFLLNRFPTPTYTIILGLVIGSIFVIYPGFNLDIQGIISIIILIITTFLAYKISKIEKN